MAELTITIPEDLKQKIEKTPHIDWSKIARDAIYERASKLALLKDIASKSELTEKDAVELGGKVNIGLHKRYEELYSELKR